MLRKVGLVAITAIALGFLIAACGGKSKSSSTNSSAAPAGTSTPAASGGYGNSSTPAAAPVALITTKQAGKLGTVLAYGSKRLTVYLFEGDKGSSSSCTGACASVWPPVTGKGQVSGAAMSADLGTFKRSDGKTQVTYKGHPLYRYSRDKDDGDTYGEGIKSFGAEWYALAPSGKKVDLS
jgi:predicted lipoprotein with Yx(FWY)xxD motif